MSDVQKKKRGVLFILCLSLGITLALAAIGRGCAALLLGELESDNKLEPIFSESYRDNGFKDYTDYEKSIYAEQDRERVLAGYESNPNYSKVETAQTVKRLESYFQDFAGWAEWMPWWENYDSALSHIDESDYYYIKEGESDCYTVYFFDVQTLTAYYIHNST